LRTGAIGRGTARVGRVHHGAHVADPLLEGLLGDTIGQALATLVEDDHASEGREAFQQVLVDGELPVEVGVESVPGMRTRSRGPSPKIR
jgi:hypothetical protein